MSKKDFWADLVTPLSQVDDVITEHYGTKFIAKWINDSTDLLTKLIAEYENDH